VWSPECLAGLTEGRTIRADEEQEDEGGLGGGGAWEDICNDGVELRRGGVVSSTTLPLGWG
jgi:hypothetical protein